MQEIIKKNSYGILGIKSSASLAKIRKRSKMVSRHISMGRDFDFDINFNIYRKERTEKIVKKAAEKLTKPKSRLIYNFFWFNSVEEIDDKALVLHKEGRTEEAIELWEKDIEKPGMSPLTKKNLALFYCLYLFEKKDSEYLRRSLDLWEGVINSTKFWKAFDRFYKLYDETGISDEVFSGFKQGVEQYVSDIYTELYKNHNDPIFIREKVKSLDKVGNKSREEILKPVYADVLDKVEKIEKTIKEEESIVGQIENLKRTVSQIKSSLQKIDDFNDSSEGVKIQQVRDKAADEVRAIGIILHNKFKKSDEALSFIKSALDMVGSDYKKNQLEEDLKIIKNFSLLGPIGDLMRSGKYKKALKKIKRKKSNLNDDEIISLLVNHEKQCILSLASKKHNKALRTGDKDPARSKKLFEKAANIIFDNINSFNFNSEHFKDFIAELKSKSKNLNYKKEPDVEKARNKFIRKAGKKFKREEGEAMVVLVNYFIYGSLTSYLANRGRDKTIAWISFAAIWIFGYFAPLVSLIAAALALYFALRNPKPELKYFDYFSKACNHCGNDISLEDNFCINCGERVNL